MEDRRYRAEDLRRFAARLLERAGLPVERASVVAEILVEGDLMGKTTHGLQLIPLYLKEARSGGMTLNGQPDVVADAESTFTWDGNYLPGPWLVREAMVEAERRIGRHGVVTAVIRRSHHIGALQAYLARATANNLMMILMASDPREESVAPHGGLSPRYSPNPVAVGIPTSGAPILVDVSLSTTANGVVNRARAEGKKLPGPWLKDAQGRPSDDPAVRFTDPPGALYPLGGADLGYKGFGLGLMVEALTAALGGHGRADRPTNWGASVFLQLIDPARFAGAEAFRREIGFLADFCRSSPVAADDPPVQMPGEGALRRRAEQLATGVCLYPGIMEALREGAGELAVEVPRPID
jgi:LDH2 family malate/lactate/ureidoglycolate dehydrogenase